MRRTEKAELNRNRTPDLYQYQATDRIPKDLPPIILPNLRRRRCLV